MPLHQGIRVHEERHDPANSGGAEAPSPVRFEEGDQPRPRLRRQGFLDGGRDELFADGPMAQECKSSTGSLRAGAFTPGGGPGSSRSARSRTGPGPSQATLAARDRRQRVRVSALPSAGHSRSLGSACGSPRRSSASQAASRDRVALVEQVGNPPGCLLSPRSRARGLPPPPARPGCPRSARSRCDRPGACSAKPSAAATRPETSSVSTLRLRSQVFAQRPPPRLAPGTLARFNARQPPRA